MTIIERIQGWWAKDAQQLTYLFFAQQGAPAAVPYDSYVRIWCSDMFLAQSRQHFQDRFPSLQASIEFAAANRPTINQVMVTRAGDAQYGPGVVRDRKLTELVPFNGGTIRLQAGLLDLEGVDHLRVAVGLLEDFAGLIGPPVATIGAISSRVANGLDKVDADAEAQGKQAILVLDRTVSAQGGGANVLAPGYHVIVRAPQGTFARDRLAINQGVLVDMANGGLVLDGYDYFVVHLEVRAERDDWRFPSWDAAIGKAHAAKQAGKADDFAAAKNAVLADVWVSEDLTPADRRRVAKRIQQELDDDQLGFAGADDRMTLKAIVDARGLPSLDEVAGLTLNDLLGV